MHDQLLFLFPAHIIFYNLFSFFLELFARVVLFSFQKRRLSTEHQNQAFTELQREKAELETQVQNLTADIARLKEEKAVCQKHQTEAESKVESLELQVKDLMMDSSKLRQEVASLKAAGQKQQAVETERETSDDWSRAVELSKNNAYLETKVEELEKHLERANNRPSAGGAMVGFGCGVDRK